MFKSCFFSSAKKTLKCKISIQAFLITRMSCISRPCLLRNWGFIKSLDRLAPINQGLTLGSPIDDPAKCIMPSQVLLRADHFDTDSLFALSKNLDAVLSMFRMAPLGKPMNNNPPTHTIRVAPYTRVSEDEPNHRPSPPAAPRLALQTVMQWSKVTGGTQQDFPTSKC